MADGTDRSPVPSPLGDGTNSLGDRPVLVASANAPGSSSSDSARAKTAGGKPMGSGRAVRIQQETQRPAGGLKHETGSGNLRPAGQRTAFARLFVRLVTDEPPPTRVYQHKAGR